MLTRTCTLKFPNGKTITATVVAPSPVYRGSIRYAGDLNLLPLPRKEMASPSVLDAHFANLAEDLGAVFSTTQSGHYDTWPE
jgi:hypothetical protein